jgi:hypothetical protein
VVEGGFGPIDLPREAALEDDVRSCRLEVEELLGIDFREAARLPRLREEARRE